VLVYHCRPRCEYSFLLYLVVREFGDALLKRGSQSKAGCDALSDAIKSKEEKLHILINNSGATWGAPFDNVPEKEGWDKIMSLNVKSLFYSTSSFHDIKCITTELIFL